MLLKVASTTHTKPLTDFQTYYSLAENVSKPECSNIIYYKVMDQRCDNKETLLDIINNLYVEFIVPKQKEYILLGDQATYERIQSIKTEYCTDLSWLIPFPGDWHFLKNDQKVLLKVYFDAGLSDLARASGYKPTAVGSNFDRIHHFLLETWEPIYRHFLNSFLLKHAPFDFTTYVSDWIKSFPAAEKQESSLRNLNELLGEVATKYPDLCDKFFAEVKTQSDLHETTKFWWQFVFEDCFAYVALHLAMRDGLMGQWDLRVAAIKCMAPLFTAFDKTNYQKLIPQHLLDMLTIPKEDLSCLQQGGFTVSILGRPCHNR